MPVARYAKMSTLNGQHSEVQLVELREHIARRGWEIVGEYVDEGISGARERRPELGVASSNLAAPTSTLFPATHGPDIY